ncbi:hypothetical protein JTB14_009503 [Gonioctena quinquepunctata]|nr:hypothetical protein JTB14_009503 [Gonioctena quinquepunctata]
MPISVLPVRELYFCYHCALWLLSENILLNSRMRSFGSFISLLLCSSIICDERGPRVRRIVGGSPADVPPADDPVVFTNFAGKSARVQGVLNFPHYVFRGIRYAHPPTRKNRFLRPQQKFLEGIVNATANAPPCIQPRPGTNLVIGNEDCLALNVFTPELPTGTEGLPVVVWIHGGGFRYGSASQYGVGHLVGKQLVVVTIQYRLGSLGFLSDGTKHLPGNVALWDMVLAVQWVRNYIGFFGGNPYRIVVMGHDTGASSALLMMLSNVAKGLASGIVAMSGTAVSRWAVDHAPQETAQEIARQNGCPTVNVLTMVKCLQSLPPDSIIMGDSSVEFHRLQSRGFMSGLSGDLGSAPVHEGFNDGRSLPGVVEDEPMNDLEKKKNPKVPLLTGIVKDETKKAVRGYLKGDILQKLKTIPDFFDKILVNNLKQFIPLNKLNLDIPNVNELGNTLTSFLPLNFKNYLKHNADKLFESLDKIADVTNDALFNVPAFLTVDKWSKNGAATFLYSFEHVGKLKKGSSFLRGSPLIGNITDDEGESNDTVGHGDDLAYLFDAYDIEGNPLDVENNLSEDDKNVREFFTQMIADFARHGSPRMNNKDVLPFSSDKNNFLQIRAKPVLAEGFKFCEMALWCNVAERLKSTACSFLNAFENVGNVLGGLLNNTDLSPDKILQKLNNTLDVLNGGNTNKVVPNLLPGTNENALLPLIGGGSSGKQNPLGWLSGQTSNKNNREETGSNQNQGLPNLLGNNLKPISGDGSGGKEESVDRVFGSSHASENQEYNGQTLGNTDHIGYRRNTPSTNLLEPLDSINSNKNQGFLNLGGGGGSFMKPRNKPKLNFGGIIG